MSLENKIFGKLDNLVIDKDLLEKISDVKLTLTEKAILMIIATTADYINANEISEFIDKSEPTTRKSLQLLEENKIISRLSDNPVVIKEMLEKRKLTGMGIGYKVCDWCGFNSTLLHEHHYPILRTKGGTETVNICPNCHWEYHYLENSYYLNDEKHNEIVRNMKITASETL